MRGRQTEFARDEEAALTDPVLFLEKGYVLLVIRDLVLLEPDVEHQLTDEAKDACFVGGICADVHPVLNLEQDIKHPLAVCIVEVFTHDEHVEHMRPGALHDRIMRLDIFRIIRPDDFVKGLQTFCMMRVQVVGFIRFDIIAALVGHDDRRGSQQFLPVCLGEDCRPLALYRARFFIGKVAAIMDKADVICRQVLPSPVQGRQFAVMRILGTDIVTGIISNKADILFPLFADMYRQIRII